MFFGIKKSRDKSLPDQKFLLDVCLRPGRKVDLVLESLSEVDQSGIRGTILVGLEKKKLILAQTRPRLEESRLGRKIFVTFLAGVNDGGRVRVGYRTVLEKALEKPGPQYGSDDAVLVVPAPKRLTRLTLRLNRRLAPPAGGGLRLFLLPRREELSLADISQGGIRFFHPGHLGWEPGAELDLLLLGRGRELGLKAEVMRSEKSPFAGEASPGVTAVRFKPGQDEAALRLGAILGELPSAGDHTPVAALPAG